MRNKKIILFGLIAVILSVGFTKGDPQMSCAYLRINLYEFLDGAEKPHDAIILAFDDRYSDAFDQEDARQQHKLGPSIGIVHSEATLSVEKRSVSTLRADIPLKILNLEQGTRYYFRISGNNLEEFEQDMMLWDDYLKKSYNFKSAESLVIEFQVDTNLESQKESRFKLIPNCTDQSEWAFCEYFN
jgi:hypothetical protein